jgi:hypothetical protein
MMVKTNGTFKLSKSTKRMMATMANSNDRNHYKRMMIDAEVAEIKAKLAKISKPKNEAKVS